MESSRTFLVSRAHFEVLGLGLEGQVLENSPTLRTALYFELLKVCEVPEKFSWKKAFSGNHSKIFSKDPFFLRSPDGFF